MTRALHKLVQRERIDDPKLLERINDEFHKTIKELGAHAINPEVVADIDRASERLRKGLGALGMRETYALMDAAALSNNPTVDELAHRTIDARFPVENTEHTAYKEANRRSRQEWREGLRIAKESQGTKPFSHALVEAEIITDKALNNDFDEVIDESNLTVREQRHNKGEAPELTSKERQDLDHYREKRSRRQERLRILEQMAEQGVSNEDELVDNSTVKYDPFADDEDEEQAA